MKKCFITTTAVLFGLLIGAPFAQDEGSGYGSEESTPTYTPPTYSTPAPAASTPSYSSSSRSDEGAPLTGIYRSVMQHNPATKLTTANYMVRPHLIDDKQFISGYDLGTTSLIDLAFSVKMAGMNVFGNADNTIAGQSRLKLGVGIGSLFGAGLIYELNKTSTDDPTGQTSTVFAGDAYGAFGSFNLGGPSVWGSLVRETGAGNDIVTKPTGVPETARDANVMDITAGFVIDAEDEGSHALSATLGVQMTSLSVETAVLDPATGNYTINTTESSGMLFDIDLRHGVILKKSADFSAYMGSLAEIQYMSTEDKDATTVGTIPSTSGFGFTLAPNLEFEKELGMGFDSWFGASVNIFTYGTAKTAVLAFNTAVPPVLVENEATTGTINTDYNGGNDMGDLSLGLRWKKGNFAVEGELSKALVRNGPDFIGGTGPGVFGAVGVTAGF